MICTGRQIAQMKESYSSLSARNVRAKQPVSLLLSEDKTSLFKHGKGKFFSPVTAIVTGKNWYTLELNIFFFSPAKNLQVIPIRSSPFLFQKGYLITITEDEASSGTGAQKIPSFIRKKGSITESLMKMEIRWRTCQSKSFPSKANPQFPRTKICAGRRFKIGFQEAHKGSYWLGTAW